MKSVRLLVGDGAGGALWGGKVAYFIKQAGDFVEILYSSRNETFRPFKYLLGDIYPLIQIPEDVQDKIVNDEELYLFYKGDYDECYIVIPDHLYRHKHSFDYKKYGVHPQLIQSLRLFTDKWNPKNVICVGLISSTPEYIYNFIPTIIKFLAQELPNYLIYFNNVTKWANKELNNGDFNNLSLNVFYFENQDFIDSLKWLSRSCYCLCVDNGIAHIAHSFGIPRTVISKRLNFDGIPWVSRWYEDLSECISYDYSPKDIARLVALNINVPQTCLIPRKFVIENLDCNWNEKLLFKY